MDDLNIVDSPGLSRNISAQHGGTELEELDKLRDEVLEPVVQWRNRASRKLPENLNATRLLRLLVEAGRQGLTGDQIGKRLGAGDGWARKEINRLRLDLEEFRTGVGSMIPWRFEITTTNNVYRAELEPNYPRKGPEAVWLPHVWSSNGGKRGVTNWLALNEPVISRDPGETFYVLHSAVNCPDREKVSQKLDELRGLANQLIPCSQYVSIGEVNAGRKIENGLREIRRDVVVTWVTNQTKTWNEVCSESFVLFGPRRNELVMAFQQTESRLEITTTSYGMTICADLSAAEQAVLEGEGAQVRTEAGAKTRCWDLADRPGRVYFGVFTRISDRVTQQVKSVICCNHGAVSDAIVTYLFSDEVEKRLIPAMQTSQSWKGLPDNYQLLFKVTLTVGTERKGRAELLMHRILADSSPA